MREIKFRGKRVDNNEWVYGYYAIWKDTVIYEQSGLEYIVIPETVGQFTGLFDTNGEKIFEGDIIRATGAFLAPCFKNVIGQVGLIEYKGGTYYFRFKHTVIPMWKAITAAKKDVIGVCELVGNAFDNPELLENL